MTVPTGRTIDFGLNAFGDIPVGADGLTVADADAVRVMVDEAVLAERVGLDAFSIGEHYQPRQVDTASMVVLAAIAGRTERLHVGTAVAVLTTQDPVRLYHQYATLDAASAGRAQLVLGRASAGESFALFGLAMEHYDQLFEENLELFLQLLAGRPVTWSGISRPALEGYEPRPRLDPGAARPWIGVGGSPESVVRAARHDLPLMLAVIGGSIERFAGHARYYRSASEEFGHAPGPVGLHSPGCIAPTEAEAVDTFWPLYKAQMERMAAIRGTRLPTREGYLAEIETGALFVGSPETVARKIVTSARTLGLARFDLKYDAHGSSIQDRARTVELLGTAVKPLVDEALAGDEPALEASPDAPEDPRLGANAVFGGRTDELAKHRDATVRSRA